MKRVTLRPKCPNPLFEQWLDEWRAEYASKGSDMQYCFGKALKSLRKYPLPLKSGKECAVLECFGDRLCLLLDRRLAEYRKTHPEVDLACHMEVSAETKNTEENIIPKKRKKTSTDSQESTRDAFYSPQETIQTRQGKEYVPVWRSGSYAILITLLSHEKMPGSTGFMMKGDLQLQAQPLCDASFTRPDPGSHYTAWSSMSQLVKRGFVHRYSNPAKFNLTDEGRKLAKQLLQCEEVTENEKHKKPDEEFVSFETAPEIVSKPTLSLGKRSKKCVSNSAKSSIADYDQTLGLEKSQPSENLSKPSSSAASCSKENDVSQKALEGENCGDTVLEPETFDIILLVDTAETTGGPKKRHDQTLAELSEMKVSFEVRRLAVGDFVWVARCKRSGVELVLPYIVERKRMDDFGGSIKDGRFREQKFRLKQSGIQNLIYLVESHGSDQHVGLPLTTLQQAAVNTQVVDGFIVKHSIDHRHSMSYLASLTSILRRTYLSKTLIACPKEDLNHSSVDDDFVMLMNFREFNKASGKVRNFLVKEMFIRHLLQMKGLSVEKALAIVERYPTPISLVTAFCNISDENMLSNIVCGAKNRNVGPIISKALAHHYSKEKLT